jgi:hypothetical protein
MGTTRGRKLICVFNQRTKNVCGLPSVGWLEAKPITTPKSPKALKAKRLFLWKFEIEPKFPIVQNLSISNNLASVGFIFCPRNGIGTQNFAMLEK